MDIPIYCSQGIYKDAWDPQDEYMCTVTIIQDFPSPVISIASKKTFQVSFLLSSLP